MTVLPPVLADALTTYSRHRGRWALGAGAAEAAAVGLIGMGALVAADAVLHPGAGARIAGSVTVWTGTLAVLIGRGVRPWLRRDDEVAVARALECAAGLGRDESLSGPVSLARAPTPGTSEWMASRALALAAQVVAEVPVRALVDRRPARKRLMLSGVLAALAMGGCLIPGGADLLLRAAFPFARIARPAATMLMVTPGDRRVPEGSALVISATANPMPEAVTALLLWDGAEPEIVALRAIVSPDGKAQWKVELPAIARPFTYTVQAGDAESQAYRIDVSQALRVGAVGLAITPPAYTGLPVRRIDGGDATILRGSTVVFTAHIDGPVVAATALIDGADVPAQMVNDQMSVEFTPETNATIALRLVDRDGLTADPAQRWVLRVNPDAPPVVSLTVAGLEEAQTAVGATELLATTATAEDDVGLATLVLEVATGIGEPSVISLPLPADGRLVDPLAMALDLAPFGLAPGDEVVLTAIATDRGGQQGRSAPLRAVVGGEGAAKLAALGRQLRTHLDALETAARDLDSMDRSWGALVARPGDGAQHRAELAILAARAAAWSDDCTAIATDIAKLTADLDTTTGSARTVLHGSANGLAAWAPRLLPSLSGDAATGRRAALSAVAELATWRRSLERGAARIEAERLVLAAEADLRRAERASQLVRGDLAWRGETAGNGLAGAWFQGTALSGEPTGRSTGLPRIDVRPAGFGDTGYSVRWTGEVHIPAPGRWTFAGTADDGLRIHIAGQSAWGETGWKDQAPTAYQGTVDLPAGWQPLVIEFYQGGGGAFLGLTMAREGQAQLPLVQEDLRNGIGGGSAGTIDPALLTAMMQAGPALGTAARDSLSAALAGLGQVPPALNVLAGPTGLPRITELVKPVLTPAAPIAAADWSLGEVQAAVATGTTIHQVARSVRDELETACAQIQVRPTEAITSDLLAAREHLIKARELADRDNIRAANQALDAARAATERATVATTEALAKLPDAPTTEADKAQRHQLERIANEMTALAELQAADDAKPNPDPKRQELMNQTQRRTDGALSIAQALAKTAPTEPPASAITATVAAATAAAAQARAERLAEAEKTAGAALTVAVAAQTAALERAKATATNTRAERPAAAAVTPALDTARTSAQAATATAKQAATDREASQAAAAKSTAAAAEQRAAEDAVAATLAPAQAAAAAASERAKAEAAARINAGDNAGAQAAADDAAALNAAARALAAARDATTADAARSQAETAATASTKRTAPVAPPAPPTAAPGTTPEAAAAAKSAAEAQAASTAVAVAAHAETTRAATALREALATGAVAAKAATTDASSKTAATKDAMNKAATAAEATAASQAAANTAAKAAAEAAKVAAAAAKAAATEVATLAARTGNESRVRTAAAPAEQALTEGAATLTAAATEGADPATASARESQIEAAAQRIAAGLGDLPDPDRVDAGILASLAEQTRNAATAATAQKAGTAATRDWAEPLARAALATPTGDTREAAVAQGREAAATAARTQAAAQRLERVAAAHAAATTEAAAAAKIAAEAPAPSPSDEPAQADGKPSEPGSKPGKPGVHAGSAEVVAGTSGSTERSATSADWARLSEPARQDVLSGGNDRFAPEQQEAIRAYLERLGTAR